MHFLDAHEVRTKNPFFENKKFFFLGVVTTLGGSWNRMLFLITSLRIFSSLPLFPLLCKNLKTARKCSIPPPRKTRARAKKISQKTACIFRHWKIIQDLCVEWLMSEKYMGVHTCGLDHLSAHIIEIRIPSRMQALSTPMLESAPQAPKQIIMFQKDPCKLERKLRNLTPQCKVGESTMGWQSHARFSP